MRWATHAYEGVALQAVEAETDEARLAHLIDAKSQEADVVLVDTAGFGNRAANVAMTSADAVLIPALSGEADVTEAENTVRLVEGLAQGGTARHPSPRAAEPDEADAARPPRPEGDRGRWPADADQHTQ